MSGWSVSETIPFITSAFVLYLVQIEGTEKLQKMKRHKSSRLRPSIPQWETTTTLLVLFVLLSVKGKTEETVDLLFFLKKTR